MSPETLEPGDVRTGFLVLEGVDRRDLTATLTNTGAQFELLFSVDDTDRQGLVRRWFAFDSHLRRPAPRVIGFRDDGGTAVLVGCRAARYRSNLGLGIGHGVIIPNYVVLGPFHIGYEKINGLRSEWALLADWAGTKVIDWDVTEHEQGRMQAVDYHLTSSSPRRLHRRMNLSLSPRWRTEQPSRRTTVLHDTAFVETLTQDSRDWKEHVDLHLAVRELVLLASWKPVGITHLQAQRIDDPERTMDGVAHSQAWRPALSHRLPADREGQDDAALLFALEDIGRAGIHRWLDIRQRFARTFDELISLCDVPSHTYSTAVVTSGVALENLGHQIAVESGLSPSGRITFNPALDRILGELVHVPFPDPQDWKRRANACYMGVKHADRPTPDMEVLVETLHDNLLVMRVWLAGRLGASPDKLSRSVRMDPHFNHSR